MTATDDLRHEHEIILVIMDAADREASSITDTRQVDVATLEKIVDFCRVFLDRCHHGKEEEYLFPLLEQRGVGREHGPVGVMLHEHDAGRQRLKAVAASLPQAGTGGGGAAAALAAELRAYAALLRAHIDKENNVLFPLADRVLSPADQETLLRAFAKHEAEEIGPGVHEKYHHLAHELAQG
ncbi:MAG: hemerythrin domain-containing protein [Syntrophobacterales bacterium]|jgi:hemerythrin-like domain-containing protein|nr:hemerythrin domain-containing protein [Syntrophobacterales bacterium]